jgi:STAM-binding protein
MAGPTALITRPMSVKEIAEKAQAFEFNPQIALRYWLRTADTLLREVTRRFKVLCLLANFMK